MRREEVVAEMGRWIREILPAEKIAVKNGAGELLTDWSAFYSWRKNEAESYFGP
jgi:hypothetical protein